LSQEARSREVLLPRGKVGIFFFLGIKVVFKVVQHGATVV
jgi:hypothetical protein